MCIAKFTAIIYHHVLNWTTALLITCDVPEYNDHLENQSLFAEMTLHTLKTKYQLRRVRGNHREGDSAIVYTVIDRPVRTRPQRSIANSSSHPYPHTHV